MVKVGPLFPCLTKFQSRYWPGPWTHLRLVWGRIHFQTHVVVVVDSIQFLAGCQTEGFNYLLAVSQSHPKFLATWPSSYCSSQANSLVLQNYQSRESPRKMDYNLTRI